MHGGKSAKGFEHPQLKDGKHSKFLRHLPESLKQNFVENLEDDAVSLREHIATSDIRTQQLLALLGDGDLGALWRKLKDTVRDMERAQEAGIDVSFNELKALVETGDSNFQTWQQINSQHEQTRKLAESQIKIELGHLDRQIKENEYIPKGFVRAFVLELADVVMKLSPESIRHEQLSLIQKRFMSLPPVIRDDAPKQLDKGK